MRCKETFQGDRCKKETNHTLSVNENPDEVHEGNFTQWKGEGDTKTVLAKAKGAIPCMTKVQRRKVDKLVRFAKNKAESGDRKTGIAVLDFVVRGLTRAK